MLLSMAPSERSMRGDNACREQYDSIREKHAAAWIQDGKAWQKVIRGLVTRLMRASEVKACADNKLSSPLTVAMMAYTPKVARGASVVGTFPKYIISFRNDCYVRVRWPTKQNLPDSEITEPLRGAYFSFSQVTNDVTQHI
jgi:hypothetical protein